MTDSSQRITDLEFSLSHLQRQYDVLNEVVTEQTAALGRADKRIAILEKTLEDLAASVESSPQDADPLEERPPHY